VSRRPPLPAGFGVIWSTVAIDLVGFGIVLPILPLYAERFGASPATIGLLVASFSAAQFVCAPILGRLSDRIGRKPVLVLSLAGTAVGSLLTALAPSLAVLFVARILDGISGASVSVAQAAVVDIAPEKQRARLLGLLSAAFGIGFVAGPALGGLSAVGGARLPFLVAAVIAGVNAVVAVRRLPETHPGSAQQATAEPARRIRQPAYLVVVAFTSVAAFAAFEATFALLGNRRFGFTVGSAGAVFALAGLVVALTSAGLVHPVVDRLGDLRALRLGLVLNGAGLAALAVAHSWWLFLPALAILAGGQGLVSPTLAAVVASGAGQSARGAALGVQQAAGGLARVLGPAVGGLVFQHVGTGAAMAAGAAMVMVPAVWVTRVLAEPAPRDEQHRLSKVTVSEQSSYSTEREGGLKSTVG
jgi:multidrug resistance protein